MDDLDRLRPISLAGPFTVAVLGFLPFAKPIVRECGPAALAFLAVPAPCGWIVGRLATHPIFGVAGWRGYTAALWLTLCGAVMAAVHIVAGRYFFLSWFFSLFAMGAISSSPALVVLLPIVGRARRAAASRIGSLAHAVHRRAMWRLAVLAGTMPSALVLAMAMIRGNEVSLSGDPLAAAVAAICAVLVPALAILVSRDVRAGLLLGRLGRAIREGRLAPCPPAPGAGRGEPLVGADLVDLGVGDGWFAPATTGPGSPYRDEGRRTAVLRGEPGEVRAALVRSLLIDGLLVAVAGAAAYALARASA